MTPRINPRMYLSILITSVILATSLSSVALGSEPSTVLQDALQELDAAIQHSGGIGSGEEVLQAAAVLAFTLDQEEINTSAGEHTLGNAYFIGGDLGRAILHYRKALAIDPSDQVLHQNLTHARSFVEPTVPGDPQNLNIKTALLSWQRVMGRWTLWIGTIGLLATGSLLWTLRTLQISTRLPIKAPLTLSLLGLVGFGLLGYDQWLTDHDQSLVIVAPGTELYSGPGKGAYQRVYDGHLGVGSEAVALESRQGWINIRLSNAQEGWIMNDQASFINQ